MDKLLKPAFDVAQSYWERGEVYNVVCIGCGLLLTFGMAYAGDENRPLSKAAKLCNTLFVRPEVFELVETDV